MTLNVGVTAFDVCLYTSQAAMCRIAGYDLYTSQVAICTHRKVQSATS